MGDDLERTEIEALLETRRELGPQYDAALVDSFADRPRRHGPLDAVTALTLVPEKGSALALIVGWGGIVGVNAVHALQGRRRS